MRRRRFRSITIITLNGEVLTFRYTQVANLKVGEVTRRLVSVERDVLREDAAARRAWIELKPGANVADAIHEPRGELPFDRLLRGQDVATVFINFSGVGAERLALPFGGADAQRRVDIRDGFLNIWLMSGDKDT